MALTKNEIEIFEKRLLTLKGQLSNTLRQVSQDVKSKDESKGYSQHQADEGTDDFDQIDRALAKIQEGTYGLCDVSGEEIPLKRLEAIPYATMTVASQDKFEKGLL